jgi:hypothetical protein
MLAKAENAATTMARWRRKLPIALVSIMRSLRAGRWGPGDQTVEPRRDGCF